MNLKESWPRLITESALIVASILLAFGIDAWWDDRRDAEAEQRHLAALALEFRQNGELLQHAHARYEQQYFEAHRIIEILDSAENHTDELQMLLASFVSRRTHHLETGAYDGLMASGGLSLIRDESLRNQLAAWPSYVSEWSEEEDADFAYVGEEVVPFLIDKIRLRGIVEDLAPFGHSESPPQIPPGASEPISVDAIRDSLEFDNLVSQRAAILWHAMRDGDELRVRLAEIVSLIDANIDE